MGGQRQKRGTSVVEVELGAELMRSLATLNISNVSGWSPERLTVSFQHLKVVLHGGQILIPPDAAAICPPANQRPGENVSPSEPSQAHLGVTVAVLPRGSSV